MLSRSKIVLASFGAAVACVAWIASSHPAGAQGAGPEFIGAASCKKCHFKQWKSWKDTKMAKSFDLLKAGEAKEAKTKASLDPAKDYTQDEKCLACHTTGYGQQGGFPKVGDASGEARKADRQGIQCESCHGAGSQYNEYMKKHEKEGYKADEAKAAGLVMPDEKTCVACHHAGADGSPTGAKFDPASLKDEKAVHVHPPKK